MEATKENGKRHFNLNFHSGQTDRLESLATKNDTSLAAIVRRACTSYDPVIDAVLSGADVMHLLAVTTSGNIAMGRWF